MTTLYTIITAPPVDVSTTFTLSSPVTARYVRHLSHAGSYGNVSELEVFA